MKTKPILFALVLTFSLQPSALHAQGALTPPGAPAPTMKTLAQIEPRTAISTLPYAISQPGGYYLTTNLTGVTGASGITINTNDVVLDLNGFCLTGVPGSSQGVTAGAYPTRVNVVVRNGTVRQWAGTGVDLSQVSHAEVDDLAASANGLNGIIVSVGAVVQRCRASGNGSYGIAVNGSLCLIRDCTTSSNSWGGIEANEGATVLNCVAYDNTMYGIILGEGGAAIHCSAKFNGSHGIVMGEASTVTDCVAQHNNGEGIRLTSGSVMDSQAQENTGSGIWAIRATIKNCQSSYNSWNGIQVTQFGTVVNNLCYTNSADGIHFDNSGHAEGNTVAANGDDGIQILSGTVQENTTEGNHYGIYVLGQGGRIVGNTIRTNLYTGLLFSTGSGNFYGGNVFFGNGTPVGGSGTHQTGTYGNVNIFLP